MGGRKQRTRELRSGNIWIIGEGITEQYYFPHIKRIFKLPCKVQPRFFGNTSIFNMEKRIEESLRNDIRVICVFDSDVAREDKVERDRLVKLRNKYKNRENVILCDSLPSVEFWFLLHYTAANSYFPTSKKVETALKKYIPGYEKTTSFLEKEKWVEELCKDQKLALARQRAESRDGKGASYSNLHKAFELLFPE